MRDDEHDTLRQLYQYRCGYCGVREEDVGAVLTVDHFEPRSRGGLHHPENWVYACHACNEFKGDFHQPDQPFRILHPLRDQLGTHVTEDADGRLRGLTQTGTFHVERLHLNRPQLVRYRVERRRQQELRQTQIRQLQRLQELEEQIQAMTEELNGINREAGNKID
ncbi:MAG: HNH endonuclease [Gemmataceae bacterium]|nr:HNH endonuclease [Gemmataceae bacterium]